LKRLGEQSEDVKRVDGDEIKRQVSLTMKLGDHFDLTDQVLVELGEVFGRDPILPMHCTSDNLNIISCEECRADAKPGYISYLVRVMLRVPIARDLPAYSSSNTG
jgi:hypothetical protein